jgi:hypothetical protein
MGQGPRPNHQTRSRGTGIQDELEKLRPSDSSSKIERILEQGDAATDAAHGCGNAMGTHRDGNVRAHPDYNKPPLDGQHFAEALCGKAIVPFSRSSSKRAAKLRLSEVITHRI